MKCILKIILIILNKWDDYVDSLEEDIRPLAPDFETIAKQTTYACDFICSFVSQTYHINLIIVSATPTKSLSIIKKIYSPASPVVIIAHLSNIEHFDWRSIIIASIPEPLPITTYTMACYTICLESQRMVKSLGSMHTRAAIVVLR